QELWHVPEASQGLDPLLGLSLGPCLLVRAAYPPVITEETGSRLGHGRQEPLTERRVDDLDDLAHRLPALPVQGNDALGVFPRRGAVVEAAGGYRLFPGPARPPPGEEAGGGPSAHPPPPPPPPA